MESIKKITIPIKIIIFILHNLYVNPGIPLYKSCTLNSLKQIQQLYQPYGDIIAHAIVFISRESFEPILFRSVSEYKFKLI